MKDVDRLVKLFRENGFTLARAKNHQIWRCPCGHIQFATKCTPGGGRGTENMQARLKREARICKTNLEEKP